MKTITDIAYAHVLIVEDEPMNASLITAMLSIVGVTNTYVCMSGREVIPLFNSISRLDLVLLDLKLPGENVYDLLRQWRQYEQIRDVPVIAVTAHVMPDVVAEAEAGGFDGFIGKPLNFHRFPDQIRRILAGDNVWEPK